MPLLPGDRIDDSDAEDLPPSRWAFGPYVRQLFEQAGWKPLPPPAPVARGDAMAYARALLEEFGGLKVGRTGAGMEAATSALLFLREPVPVEDYWARMWPRLRGTACIGTASEGYVVMHVDGNGNFLMITDVDAQLYDLGSDFVWFSEKMLSGWAWPRAEAH
jgi:hypothetical protein